MAISHKVKVQERRFEKKLILSLVLASPWGDGSGKCPYPHGQGVERRAHAEAIPALHECLSPTSFTRRDWEARVGGCLEGVSVCAVRDSGSSALWSQATCGSDAMKGKAYRAGGWRSQ